MNSSSPRFRSIVLASMFAVTLMGCGSPDTGALNCPGEPCLESSSDRPGTTEQPLPCETCEPPPDDDGSGGTGTPPQYVTVNVVVKNPTTVAKDMRAWASATVGWPAQPVAHWEMQRKSIAPGEVVTFSSVMRIPYGALLSIDNTVWDAEELWSGRGWGPNAVSSPSVTCVAEVRNLAWPNAAFVSCANG